jgi:preprotein translocase subunit SecG
MYTFLLAILIFDALILGAAILLQSGKGGGLAASFGGASSSSDSVIGTRQAGNLLTKASWWCGGIFLGLSFILQMMSARTAVPESVLDRLAVPTQTAPATPGGANAPAPAAPLTPQQGTTPPATTPPATTPPAGTPPGPARPPARP